MRRAPRRSFSNKHLLRLHRCLSHLTPPRPLGAPRACRRRSSRPATSCPSTLDCRPLDPSTASPPPPPLRHIPRHGRQRSPARLRAGAGRAQCHAVGGQPRTERAGPRVPGEVPEVGTFDVACTHTHGWLTQCATARSMDCHPGHARVELRRRCCQAVRCHDAQGQGASLLPAAPLSSDPSRLYTTCTRCPASSCPSFAPLSCAI